MSKSKALSLLRSSIPSPHPRRCFATASPALPSASHYTSSPPLPLRSSSASTASPIPTSSKFSLDHPFWLDKPDPTISALGFATDDELFQTLLLPAPALRGRGKGKGKGKEQEGWTTTLDPALAFIALRSRPTYTAFLQCIQPFIANVYLRLRSAGQHQLLVSDLLLRHPDPRLLRDILEMDAIPVKRSLSRSFPISPSLALIPRPESLRTSLIASIYSIIAWQIRRGSLPRLTHRGYLSVCRAMAAQNDTSAVISAWHDLRPSSHLKDKNTGYTLLSFVLDVSRSDPVAAFGMLHALVRDEIVPRGILLRGVGDHPRRREMLILGATVRSCLIWGMDDRARKHVLPLLDAVTEIGWENAGEATDLVLDVCRGAIAAGDDVGLDWCIEVFRRLTEHQGGEYSPGSLVDAWIDAASGTRRDYDEQGLFPRLWYALKTSPPAVSARSILALARHCPHRDTVNIVNLLEKLEAANSYHISSALFAHVARIHISAGDTIAIIDSLTQHWQGSPIALDNQDLVRLIKRIRSEKSLSLRLIHGYELALSQRDVSMTERLALIQAYLYVKDDEGANKWLAGLGTEDSVRINNALREMALHNHDLRSAVNRLRKHRKAGVAQNV